MRIFVWHGYLLGGTGSNIYARQLSREWSREGHDVVVFSQEPHPERFDLGGAETVRPDVGGFLPVFVIDEYDGYEVKRVQDSTRAELDAWVEANAASMREHLPADLVFVNHVILGGPVGEAVGRPLRRQGARLRARVLDARERRALCLGQEALAGAVATIVGSEHIREVLADVCGQTEHVHEVPPGVDVELWRPAPKEEALTALVAESRKDPPNPGNANERLPDEGNAERLEAFLAGDRPTVVYFGKLIENKGVQVLFEALRGLDARRSWSASATTGRSSSAWQRASTSSSPARSSTVTSSTCSRSPMRRSCPRSSPRPSGWSPPRRPRPAARRSWRTTRGSRRSRRASSATTRPSCATSRASRTATRASCRSGSGTARPRADEREALRAAAREASVSLWSWTSVARRILEAAARP